MTFPTPIRGLKSPRPMDESNLSTHLDSACFFLGIWGTLAKVGGRWQASDSLSGGGGAQSLLFAPELIVLLFGVVQAAGIFDGHLVTFLRLVDAIARLKNLASDSHGDRRG